MAVCKDRTITEQLGGTGRNVFQMVYKCGNPEDLLDQFIITVVFRYKNFAMISIVLVDDILAGIECGFLSLKPGIPEVGILPIVVEKASFHPSPGGSR